jgi:ribonuclease I
MAIKVSCHRHMLTEIIVCTLLGEHTAASLAASRCLHRKQPRHPPSQA